MKKFSIALCLLLLVITGFSQSVNDLFDTNKTKVSWLGIDFTQAKFIGEFSEFSGAGMKNVMEIRDNLFPAWNMLVLNEPSKYDIKGMLKKDNFVYDIEEVMNQNSITPPENMEAYNTSQYTEGDIQDFVNTYTLKSFEGLGVVFIVESFNKPEAEAVIHVVIFDMETQIVLIQERVIAKPRGFGIRNYWAGAVYDVIKKVNNTYYRQWKALYY